MLNNPVETPMRGTNSYQANSQSFAPLVRPITALRAAITANYRRSEAECLGPLLDQASVDSDTREAIALTARKLVASLRAQPKTSGVAELVHEYSLSSQEGVALMCLAEALLRIPDAATRDALIRDKISAGDIFIAAYTQVW
jgi:RHH-type proline utilization regulon transcriptional repressor/proline dehydrogenase/delta 1-pyrroline-5-carboxylate dehydrogenase